MCEESEGREKLLRIEVMTLREQLCQAMAARESCLSEYRAVEERCRMLERTLANAAYSSRERGEASGGGAAQAAQLDGEVITKELGSIRTDSSQRYALQRDRGGGEAQEQWFHKWGCLLDDAMRKITGTGPVATTLQVCCPNHFFVFSSLSTASTSFRSANYSSLNWVFPISIFAEAAVGIVCSAATAPRSHSTCIIRWTEGRRRR